MLTVNVRNAWLPPYPMLIPGGIRIQCASISFAIGRRPGSDGETHPYRDARLPFLRVPSSSSEITVSSAAISRSDPGSVFGVAEEV
jgi:hypothetical protein